MTLKSERFEVYNTVFNFMIEHNINSVPVKAVEIANLIDAELIPLSTLAKQSGLSSEDIISVLGSHDGVTCVYHTQNKNVHKIIYNDKQSKERIRFTCLEECSHILLGHTEDPRFGIFSQSYEEMVYLKYDELARIAAGLFCVHHSCSLNISRICLRALLWKCAIFLKLVLKLEKVLCFDLSLK